MVRDNRAITSSGTVHCDSGATITMIATSRLDSLMVDTTSQVSLLDFFSAIHYSRQENDSIGRLSTSRAFVAVSGKPVSPCPPVIGLLQ